MVDERSRGPLGLERRGLLPTAVVALVILVYAAGLPAIDALLDPSESGVPAGNYMTVRAGTAGLGRADRVDFTPATGWAVESRRRGRRTLSYEGITFALEVRSTSRDAPAVLAATEDVVGHAHDGVSFNPEQSFTTASGLVGVSASFVGNGVAGLAYAFAAGDVGISVTAIGPPTSLLGPSADVVAGMARTVTVR